MSAKDTIRTNKPDIIKTLSGDLRDYRLILNKVHARNLIIDRDYNNLKSLREDVEGHVVELVDKIMNKGETTCQAFLDLLQTDEEITATFPDLEDILPKTSCPSSQPVQACSADSGSSHDSALLPPVNKKEQQEEFYELKSQPVGLCVIINNENFLDGRVRRGTNTDAENLANVFTWLGFRVLMCKDQTKDQMERALRYFASLSDLAQQQLKREFNVQEWCDGMFTDPQQDLQHGDAFICCILSHGKMDVVSGIDKNPLAITDITTTFKATEESALTGKPKVFLIQACQGPTMQRGVLVTDLEEDDSPVLSIPEQADILVALATVKNHKARRNRTKGSWFFQDLCQQLRECCPRGEDINKILTRVNKCVSEREGGEQPGEVKQMCKFESTLRKTLVLSPHRI